MVRCPIQLPHMEKMPKDLGTSEPPSSCLILPCSDSCTRQHPESVILGSIPVGCVCGVPKVMRCLRPSHHAANIGITSSNTRTARNMSKGIQTGDGTTSCGRGVGIIMDGEHRCVWIGTNGVVGRFWELLQDLWTTPESLKVNPQLPYNPPYLICHPWTTYHLHRCIFVPIAQSLHSCGP